MLEEEPLDEEGQKKSRKLALRSKLRGYKRKTEQLKSLNIKKMHTDGKRKKIKLAVAKQKKHSSHVQVPQKTGLFQPEVTEDKPVEFNIDMFLLNVSKERPSSKFGYYCGQSVGAGQQDSQSDYD